MSEHSEILPGALVRQPDELEYHNQEGLRWARVFGPKDGTRRMSLFRIDLDSGRSPAIVFDGSEAVWYLLEGHGRLSIGDRPFSMRSGFGAHVRAGETCRLERQGSGVSRWLVAVCPGRNALRFAPSGQGRFDSRHPERVVDAGAQEQHATADRFYKLLVGPSVGSDSVTQFVGRLPPSRAPEHYHLYEEVICILDGHGRLWAGDEALDVAPGSLIFLPRRQRHSLECLSETGMELVGMFYPAGSPAVNYR
ncbi:MAG: cupin domain-containing protein [Xanthomonadales bacterium]|nr:cupin domain-containing protein [Xanthomonadales bacterium]